MLDIIQDFAYVREFCQKMTYNVLYWEVQYEKISRFYM